MEWWNSFKQRYFCPEVDIVFYAHFLILPRYRIYYGAALNITVIVGGNGIGNSNLNPEQDSLYFTSS